MLLNNGDMATYPGGYPVAREKFAVTHMTGDYAKIAEGLGAVGIVVKQPAEIAPALAKAQTLNKEGQPVLIDVHSNLEARRSRFDQGGGGRPANGARQLGESQALEERLMTFIVSGFRTARRTNRPRSIAQPAALHRGNRHRLQPELRGVVRRRGTSREFT